MTCNLSPGLVLCSTLYMMIVMAASHCAPARGDSVDLLRPEAMNAFRSKTFNKEAIEDDAERLFATEPKIFDFGDILGPGIDDFEVGRFEGLESVQLRWVRSDWFELRPSDTNAFGVCSC